MVNPDCPDDAELLAWWRTPLDDPRSPHTAHVNSCASCQHRLGQLDEAEEQRITAAERTEGSEILDGTEGSEILDRTEGSETLLGDDLLGDLRRQPPVDELENEVECVTAGILAGLIVSPASSPDENSRRPDLADVAVLAERGHYEILGVLGRGGMGIVYKARNLKLNRLVAIKVLPTLTAQSPAAVARFEREMKAVARLTHPHVVAAHDAGEAEGKHFLVLEYVDGSDLKSLVNSSGPLPVARAVDYLLQAARGLHYAHEQGIIHRDVKPANLMVDHGGAVKVLDLGLARLENVGENQADLTGTGMMMGTVDYLAPEQAAGTRGIDRRVDVYGLGCSLYYLLTGKPLYDADSVIQKVLAHREKPIPSLRGACPECPASLERVFAKMVAKRPEQRQPTMAAVVADLEKVLASLEGSTLAASARALPEARRRLPGKRRTLGAALAVALLALGAVMVPLFVNRPATTRDVRDGEVIGPKEVPQLEGIDLGEGMTLELIRIEPGTFLMGSSEFEALRRAGERAHDVEITRPFYLGKYAVTQEHYARVTGKENPSAFCSAGEFAKAVVGMDTRRFPVESVSWDDATACCDLLTKKHARQLPEGLRRAGYRFALPTEAQYEYACRAGTTTPFHFGRTLNGTQANCNGVYPYGDQSKGPSLGRPQPVGSYPANKWGLHDMHGNVRQWCADCFDFDYYVKSPAKDPCCLTRPDEERRAVRGGGWENWAHGCRAAFRGEGLSPASRKNDLGFRVCLRAD